MDLISKERKVLLVTGKTGSGKTRLAKMLRRQWRRSVTLDPMRYEYPGNVFFRLSDLYDYFEEIDATDPDVDFCVTCRFDLETAEIETMDLFTLCENVENMLVLVEEATLYFEPFKKIKSFQRLVSQGRHSNISLLCISQRVPEVDTTFRAQANTLVTFLQTAPTDLDGLYKWGFNTEHVVELEKFDSRYHVPAEGQHYLCEGEKLSTYGITVKESQEIQREKESQKDILSRQPERSTEGDGV